MRKVIMMNEPENNLNNILLTKYYSNYGWVNANTDFSKVKKIVYLGKCKVDGDMFAVYTDKGIIAIAKGFLNNGTY